MVKSILLHIYEDDALDGRLSVALDLCRAHDAHLTCAYITPYSAYVGLDPVGGIFASGAIIDSLRESEKRTAKHIEARLSKEDVRWDWQSFDGDPAQTLISLSSLADLLIISQIGSGGSNKPWPLVDDVAVYASCAVLIVPEHVRQIDALAPVVIGWNASTEAGRAIRLSLPALKLARSVTLVSVGEDGEAFPQAEASTYLSRHDITSDLVSFEDDAGPADVILTDVAKAQSAGAIVIGAYGHSRLRETLLGGVTRRLTTKSDLPIYLGR
jgi:nucleotide-binding universal stress UspA family protein